MFGEERVLVFGTGKGYNVCNSEFVGGLYENAIYGKDLNDGACADDGCIFRVGGSVCSV